jgi:hypothetical protein
MPKIVNNNRKCFGENSRKQRYERCSILHNTYNYTSSSIYQNKVKWNEVKSKVQYTEWVGGVFMEKVYRSIKWWEVKVWGERMSELMIGEKNNYKKLYTVLSYLGIFTLCTCCILICLVCIVAPFKLCCV